MSDLSDGFLAGASPNPITTQEINSWRSLLPELAASLWLIHCEDRVLFNDISFNGATIMGQGDSFFIWGVQKPDGQRYGQGDMIWSICHDLKEHRFDACSEALMSLDAAIRSSLLKEGLKPVALHQALMNIAGVRDDRLEPHSLRDKALPWIDGALAWAMLSSAFYPRSDLFFNVMNAFKKEGLLGGKGTAMFESQTLNEQMPEFLSQGDGRKKGGAL